VAPGSIQYTFTVAGGQFICVSVQLVLAKCVCCTFVCTAFYRVLLIMRPRKIRLMKEISESATAFPGSKNFLHLCPTVGNIFDMGQLYKLFASTNDSTVYRS
jgi:hypothetical protein